MDDDGFMKLHFKSHTFILGGLILALLAALSTGAPQAIRPITNTVYVGHVPAEWWTFVVVKASNLNGNQYNVNYMVPSDRYLVVTDYSPVNDTASGRLLVNGANDPNVSINDKLAPVRLPGTASVTHGTRLVFQPGTVLSLPPASNGQEYWCNFWGYLEPIS